MEPRTVCNSIIIREVAQELGLPREKVKAMVDAQSEYTALVMASGSFDHIRWPYLGAFKSKPKEIQMLNHLQGMTPDQQREFKIAVRTKKIVLNGWEKKRKKNGPST